MGARAEQLAGKFEALSQEANTVVERLTDAEWTKVTSAEKWSVGVVAHHIAEGHEGLGGLIDTLAKGRPMPNVTMDMVHEGNAKHAKEHANTTKETTLALLKANAAKAASMVRGLSDVELDRSGALLAGVPAMTVAQAIEGFLIGHINGHLGSIRATVGAK